MKIFFFLLLLLSGSAFAAGTGVTTAQPVTGYMVLNGQNVVPVFAGANGIQNTTGAFASLHAALNGSPSVSARTNGTATASNPSAYTATTRPYMLIALILSGRNGSAHASAARNAAKPLNL